MTKHVITFFGNYGEIDVDAATGEVVVYRPEEGGEPDYADIVRVDLDERRRWYAAKGLPLSDPQPGGDILDVGFWTSDGTYEEPADDWRELVLLDHSA